MGLVDGRLWRAAKTAGAYAAGRHTRRYWNRCTPAAFDFLAANLA